MQRLCIENCGYKFQHPLSTLHCEASLIIKLLIVQKGHPNVLLNKKNSISTLGSALHIQRLKNMEEKWL